jgi:predicted PurR-regulated permease PerM
MSEHDGAANVVVVRPRFVIGAMAWVLLGLLAVIVLERSRHVLMLIAVALVLAALVRAPIDALSRNVPRWAAIAVVVLGSIVAVGGVLALGTIELKQQVDDVSRAVTSRIEQVDPESALGEFLVEGRVAERISDHLGDIPSNVLIGSPNVADGAALLIEALLVVVLAVYALVNGPRLVRPLAASQHRWWAVPVRRGVAAGASQVRRLIVVAVASGVVGFVVAMALGLPGTSVLAIWVGVWASVPIFGPIVGYAPVLVLASLEGWPQMLVAAAVGLASAYGSWLADRHFYGGGPSRVRTGPFGLAVALVIGLQYNWLVGPVVAVFLMAATVSTLAAFASRRDRSGGDELLDDGIPDEQVPSTRSAPAPKQSVWGRLDRRSALHATALVVVVVAAIAMLIDLAPVPAWVIIGVTLAIALDPLVSWIMKRTRVGRGSAIAIVIVGLLTFVTALLLFAVPSVAESVRDLDDQLPRIAADLEELPLIGGELAERGIADRLQEWIEDAPHLIADDSAPLEGALRSVGDGLLATFWILLITITGLVDGHRVRHGLRTLFPHRRRDEVSDVDDDVRQVVARYAVGSVVIAAIAGSAVFVIALVAGIPLAPLLGVWAAVSNFIPQVGGYIGGAPLVVMAFTAGAGTGLIVAAVYVVYMQIENRIIQPVIVSKAVDIPPFVAMAGVLIGGATAGVVGAVLVTPLIAVAKSLHQTFRTRPTESSLDPAPPPVG